VLSAAARRLATGLLSIAILAGLPSSSAAADPLYGVTKTTSVSDAELSAMRRGGVDVLRLRISWPEVQPAKSAPYEWGTIDDTVTRAASAGVEVVPYLHGTPAWAASCRGRGSCGQRPPSSAAARSAWRRFVSTAVGRYGRGGALWQPSDASPQRERPIRYWQIWDRPNLASFAGKATGARKYANLLEISQEEIALVDPDAQVVLGSLPASPRAGNGSSASQFLRRLLQREAGASFAAIALEPMAASVSDLRDQITRVREVLADQDLASKRTWITPVGWASDHGSSPRLSVGLEGQRRLLQRSFRLLRAQGERWRIDSVIWSAWRDGPSTEACSWCHRSGLLRRSGKIKPAWRAFRRIAGRNPPELDHLPPPGRSFFGVAPSEPPRGTDLELMSGAGVGTMRFVASWEATQLDPGGPFRWDYLDRIFEGVALHGIDPIPVLTGTPTWDPDLTAGGDLSGWGAFVEAALDRYGPNGRFWTEFGEDHPNVAPAPPRVWQIWNEQNAPEFWPPTPSPVQFAQLLDVSASVIRRVDPQAEIMLGGMFGTPPRSEGIEAGEFLSRLYDIEGAAADFDIVALHPYAFDLGGIEQQFLSIRSAMAAAGDRATDTWVTELGWSSVPDPRPEWAGYSRTLQGQADTLASAGEYLLNHRKEWQLRGLIWYTWRDPAAHVIACPFCQDAGLLEHDFSPKPSLNAYRELSATAAP